MSISSMNMRTASRGCLILALVASTIQGTLLAAEPRSPSEGELPYAGQPAPAQLQVLAPLVGNWSTDIQTAPNAQSPQGIHFTGKAVGQRLLNGQFIRVDGRTSNGTTREEYFILYGYDAGKAVYRRWYFSSIGLASEFEGHWNEASREMTWTLLNPSGKQTGIIVYSIAPDAITTRITYKDGDGNVLRAAVNRATRVPSSASSNGQNPSGTRIPVEGD